MTQFASTLYPQTNPSNPVLLAYREYFEDRMLPLDRVATLFLKNWNHLWSVRGASRPQQEHAKRVLTRLASLSG